MPRYTIIALIWTTLLTIAFVWNLRNKDKVAYVRTHDLIYEYTGTKEAMIKFNRQKESLQANVDTLKIDFKNTLDSYNEDYSVMDKLEKDERENILFRKEQEVQRYSQAIDDKIKQQDQKMMEEVLTQVNSFISAYGREQGYQIILGTTSSGNVLYGKESLDITDKVLTKLNESYEGK